MCCCIVWKVERMVCSEESSIVDKKDRYDMRYSRQRVEGDRGGI